MRGTRKSLARRVRTIVVALLPAVVVISMFVLERPAGASPSAPADDTSTVTVTSTPSPDPNLTLSKTADSGSVVAGNPIGFKIVLTHSGDSADSNVTLTDTLSSAPGTSWSIDTAGTSGWGSTCMISSFVLSCGGTGTTFNNSDTATVHVTSPTTLATCDPAISDITNTAKYDAMIVTGAPVHDEASAETIVTCPPGVLTLTKVADLATVSAGDAIGYTITASNTGGTSIGPVLVNDPLPGNSGLEWTISPTDPDCAITLGTLSCDFGWIDPGDHHSVHITSLTTAGTCGTVDNTASAELGTDNIVNGIDRAIVPDQVEITAEAKIIVQCPDLTITKTSDLYQGVGGKKISWTITVTNEGPGTAHDVVLTDDLSAFGPPLSVDDTTHCGISLSILTCNFHDMAPSAAFTVHVSAVLSSIGDCGEIRNAASVVASNESMITSLAITKVLCPNVSVVKTPEYGPVNNPTRGFAIVVSSTGTGAAKNVKLSDPLASGVKWSITGGNGKSKCKIAKGSLTCSFGTMKAGKSFTVHIKVVQKICSNVTNTATVSASNEPSFELGDNTSTATVGCAF